MSELGFLKRIYHADEKAEKTREYKPAMPFVISSPVRETSPEVLRDYIRLIAGIAALVFAIGALIIFR